MKKKIVRRPLPEQLPELSTELHPIMRRIYQARGITTAKELECTLTHLLPYQALAGIEQACQHLAQAVTEQQKILILGDFDADGATSTAVAVTALRMLGAKQVHYLVPNRFEFGYGITPEIVKVAAELKPDIIITVDNGIANLAGVAAAKAAGIKVVITDHHLPGAELPNADAIVNPCQPGDRFPTKCLAGVGVIFYVMLALRAHLRDLGWFATQEIAEPNMSVLLDLVALGTVADLVPLDHNNRILVHQGIQRIRAGKARPGIQALLKIAGRAYERVTTIELGFALGPRLNAAGRLTDMSLGIECLLAEDFNRAYELATQLSVLNEERRLIEQEMQQQAFAELAKFTALENQTAKLPLGLCLFDEKWHQGVIGLLASRLKDRLHRPVIIFAPGTETELKGSARSIPGLHIRDLLAIMAAKHPHLIIKFGGHAMAAGLTIAKKNYTLFAEIFAQEVQALLGEQAPCSEIHSDGELDHADFNLELAELLRAAGPWGQAFPEPVFDGRFRLLQQWLVGGKHLKLSLGLENSNKPLEGIAFNVNLKEWPNHRMQLAHIAYRLSINEFQGRKTVQLIIEQLEGI